MALTFDSTIKDLLANPTAVEIFKAPHTVDPGYFQCPLYGEHIIFSTGIM